MPGMNKVMIGGYVSRDPEVRALPSGDKVANFSIPTSEKWTDKQTGEQKEATTWHNIVCFNEHICGIIEQYVTKGTQVVVLGKVRIRPWTDQQGVEKIAYEVEIPRFGAGELHLMGQPSGGGGRDAQYDEEQRSRYKKSEGGSVNDTGQGMTRRAPAPAVGGGSKYGDLDDDIPF